MRRLTLFLASGFGVGYLPGPKGTYGTIVGVGLYFALRQLPSLTLYAVVTVLGVVAAIGVAGRAETILDKIDAQEIVIDELACFPIAMLGTELIFGKFAPDWSFTDRPAFYWVNLAVVFAIFRIFDILKPPPVRNAQKFAGGWGIVADDLLAAIMTSSVSALLLFGWFWITSLRA